MTKVKNIECIAIVSSHTPGPWKVYSDGTKTFILAPVNGRIVAVDLYDVNTDTPVEEINANAQLIATAPKMLALLRKMVRLIEDSCGWNATGIFPEEVYGIIGESIGEEDWRA